MEEAEKVMSEISEEQQNSIRRYLMGSLHDEAELRLIEKNLLLDDDFAERLAIAEDELVEDYLDGALSETERRQFVEFFLISAENKNKLRLLKNLRRYAAARATVQEIEPAAAVEKPGWFEWRKIFALPAVRLATVVLLVFGLGFGIWRTVFYQSDVDRGLAQLRLAYRGQRPVEARTTVNFDYAPLSVTRGENAPSITDEKAHSRAERFLLDAAEDSANAEAHHALGLLYLADRKYEPALDEFNRALKLTPDDAKLLGDLGAATLETAQKAAADRDGAKTLEFLDRSLGYFDRAIALNPALPEPKFNRALCLEALRSPEQAKQAWREYLLIDSSSRWAEEAGRRLQILESQASRDVSAAEIESEFLAAVSGNNSEEAWRLLSRNRELISGKYLPQRLATSYIESPASEKKNLLTALEFAGRLESERIGDPFALELARFYADLPEDKLTLLKQAKKNVQNGYGLCLKFQYGAALDEFTAARDLFLQADDAGEAQLSEYLIGYCLINTNRTNEGILKFEQSVDFFHRRKYKWLEATSLHWLAGGYKNLKRRTEAKKTYEQALALASEIKDSYAVQRNLIEMAKHNAFVGQKQPALDYLQRVLIESDNPENSLRQKYRNYDDALRILNTERLFNAAKTVALEAVALSDKLNDGMFKVLSRGNAGLAFAQTGEFTEARNSLSDAKEKAEAISDPSSRSKMTAYCLLKSGYVERQTANYEQSAQFYEEAVRSYETIEIPANLYEAQKGRLLAYLALGKKEELAEQIPITLQLNEEYREKILEEQERTGFFDTEESVYDIAVQFEADNGRPEQAYDYAETSSSRSLLDWLQKGANLSGEPEKIKILLRENASPLSLSDIRAKMPDGVQLVQYSVLENKLLIWLVSKEKFVVVPVELRSAELREKIEEYTRLLKQKNDPAAQADVRRMSKELYSILISPVLDELDPAQEVCLIPGKFLFYLPFAALLSPSDEPFIAQFSIVYAPSANVFLFSTAKAAEKTLSADEHLLVVGNPAFDRRKFDLANLPTAEDEASEVASDYDNPQILTGAGATKKKFLDSIGNADIIHFAGHYVVVPDNPLSSFLVLAQNGETSDGDSLTNAELVGEKLPRAKLIVLSACRTGIENYYNGEGLIGLSRTFLAAGVPLVIASGWSVDTEAAAMLMKRFHYFRRQKKLPSAAALRSAQLEMLAEPNGRFRQPYYWAAFAAFGGYTTF